MIYLRVKNTRPTNILPRIKLFSSFPGCVTSHDASTRALVNFLYISQARGLIIDVEIPNEFPPLRSSISSPEPPSLTAPASLTLHFFARFYFFSFFFQFRTRLVCVMTMVQELLARPRYVYQQTRPTLSVYLSIPIHQTHTHTHIHKKKKFHVHTQAYTLTIFHAYASSRQNFQVNKRTFNG